MTPTEEFAKAVAQHWNDPDNDEPEICTHMKRLGPLWCCPFDDGSSIPQETLTTLGWVERTHSQNMMAPNGSCE